MCIRDRSATCFLTPQMSMTRQPLRSFSTFSWIYSTVVCGNRATTVSYTHLDVYKRQIQERGTHTQLLEKDNGIYRELYEAQFARL